MFYDSDSDDVGGSEVYIRSDDETDPLNGGGSDSDIDDDDGEGLATMALLSYEHVFERSDGGVLTQGGWLENEEDDANALDLQDIIRPLVIEPPPPPANQPPPSTAPRVVEGGVVLKPSAATRWMERQPAVLFEIDRAWNREKLVEMFTNDKGGDPRLDGLCSRESLFVGYVNKAAVGVAAALVEDAATQDKLLRLLPNARLSAVGDASQIRPFMKEERAKASAPAAAGAMPLQIQRPPRPKNLVVGRDVELLRELLTAAGGPTAARFACVDVEAAVVRPGSIPLPLEIAIVPVSGASASSGGASAAAAPPLFHSFFHPGVIIDQKTALALSTCEAQGGGHGIPVRRASFLRRDYDVAAAELLPLFSHCLDDGASLESSAAAAGAQDDDKRRGWILINRGHLMDINGIRWVFAAGHAMHGREGDIPPIFIFEIETLAACLGLEPTTPEGAEAMKEILTGVKDVTGRVGTECWYHRSPPVVETFGDTCHCALHDASALATGVNSLIRRWAAQIKGHAEEVPVSSD